MGQKIDDFLQIYLGISGVCYMQIMLKNFPIIVFYSVITNEELFFSLLLFLPHPIVVLLLLHVQRRHTWCVLCTTVTFEKTRENSNQYSQRV